MKKIPLLEKKTFGTLLNDSIEFIIQNFIPYSKAFLILVLPPLILVAAMMVPLYNGLINMVKDLHDIHHLDFGTLAAFSTQITLLCVLFIVFMLVSLLQNTLTYQYILLYEHIDDPATITVAALWDGVKSNYGFMLGTFLWFLAIFFIFMIVSVGLIVFISAMIGSKILVGLFIFAWVIFYVYMILPIMLFFFVRIRERQGPIDALVRCFRLTYGHWWRTFGGVFLIAIIALVLQSICLAPLTTMAGTSAFPYTMSRHYDLNAMLTPLFGITQGVAVLVSVFFSAFTDFVICLNYYSLVSLTDGDAIDTAPAAQEAGESVDQ